MKRGSFFMLLLMAGAVCAADKPREVTLSIDTNRVTAAFDPRQALGAGLDGHWQGETARMLSPENVREMLRAGLGPISVRLRTELAVEAWHWNPKGAWSDPVHRQGYWISDAKPVDGKPILLSYGYKLPRRGNTLDEANDDGFSRLDDDDLSTFWKSNPYLTPPYTGQSESFHPQWVVLDFGKPVEINSVRIQWGEPYAKCFTVEYADSGRVYFGGHPRGLFSVVWHTFPHGTITGGSGGDQFLKLAKRQVRARYIRIWMTKASGAGRAAPKDLRDSLGYAIREISAGYADDFSFDDHVVHLPGKNQTLAYVSSTDPWHRACDRDPKVEQPGIDLIRYCGVTRGLPVMIPLPVFYDTPENAIALADYARRSGLAVGRLELGEEPDGQRVAPRDFGALYAQVAAGVRKVIPDAVMGGPSFVTADAQAKDDTYRFDHHWWIHDFRSELTRLGQSGDLRFLSFEWYPFDDVSDQESKQLPEAYGMMERAMARLRREHLPLVIGEFNYSVFPCRSEVDLSGALLNAETAAQFLCEGGDAAYYYGYEPNKLEQTCGSWGNQLMLLRKREGDPATPVATFQALHLLSSEWLDPKGGTHRSCRVSNNLPKGKKNLLSAFALYRPDGTWSLLVINKDPKRPVNLTIKGVQSGSLRFLNYSAAEYAWQEEEAKGHPARNLPPSVRKEKSDEAIILPPWSMAVLKEQWP